MTYYVSGGIYQNKTESYRFRFDKDYYKFGLVNSSGRVYVTTDKNGLQSTKHHSSLYEVSEDFNSLKLVDERNGGLIRSPKTVQLSEIQRDKILNTIKTKWCMS